MGMMTEEAFKEKERELQLKAEDGDIEAYKQLGNLYYSGVSGNEKNDAKAFPFWLQAADKGDDYAAGIVGVKMFCGLMGDEKRAEAFPYLERAAKHSEEYGYATKPMIMLAHAYRTGVGCDVDKGNAIIWYQFAALKNNAVAQYYLACLGLEISEEERVFIQPPLRWLCCSYINGFKKAEEKLHELMSGQQPVYTKKEVDDMVTDVIDNGICPMSGIGLNKELYEKISQLYIRQADEGDVTPMRFAGDFTITGYGTEEEGFSKDVDKAIAYYRRAAELGDGDSARKLGQFYLKSDEALAFKYISQAAKWNDPKARYEMGLLYRFGIGCKPDPRKAIQFLKPLALLNHGNSQYDLFGAMMDTRVEERTDDDAVHNMEIFMDALHWLACAYLNGVEEAIATAKDMNVSTFSYWNDRLYFIKQFGVDESKYPVHSEHPAENHDKTRMYQSDSVNQPVNQPVHQPVNQTRSTQTQNETEEITQGCKIWFWFVLVMNAISAISSFAIMAHSPSEGLIAFISGVVLCLGAAFILFYHKKSGLYMIIAMAIIVFIFNLINGANTILSILGAILNPVISYYFVNKNANAIQ